MAEEVEAVAVEEAEVAPSAEVEAARSAAGVAVACNVAEVVSAGREAGSAEAEAAVGAAVDSAGGCREEALKRAPHSEEEPQ